MQVLDKTLRNSRFCTVHRGAGSNEVLSGNLKAAERGKTKNSGKMFIQIPIGQRVSRPDGGEIMKFSLVSFTLPDLVDKNFEFIGALKQENSLLATMLGDTVSFNRDGSLLGSFGKADERIGREELNRLFLDIYRVAERLLMENREGISAEDMDEFRAKHSERKGKVGNLVGDAELIFSMPEHTGAIAYRNSERFGQSLFRMEALYEKQPFGKYRMITRGSPAENYKIRIFDQSIATDEGDKAFISAMLDFIKMAYKSKASTVIGLQVNNTATVARCGAIDSEEMARHSQLIDKLLFVNGNGNGSVKEGGAAGSSHNGSSSGASDSSEASNLCSGCGKTTNSGGQDTCRCKSSAEHRQKHQSFIVQSA